MPRPSLLLIVLGVALLLTAMVAGAALIPRTAEAELRLPEELGGLPRIELKTGEAAVGEVRRLHGESFALTSAAFARYGSGGEVTLWIAGASSEGEAAALVASMTTAIARGGSPFSPGAPETIAGVTLYPLSGMGQEHFYFQSDRLVLWLAADPGVAEAARRQVLEAYR